MSEQQVGRDTFSDVIPERVWINITNRVNGVEGTVRIVLDVNGQERELFNGYVIDGTIAQGNSLTWLIANAIAAQAVRVSKLEKDLEWASACLKAALECQDRYVPENSRLREALNVIAGAAGYSEKKGPLIEDILNTAMQALESGAGSQPAEIQETRGSLSNPARTMSNDPEPECAGPYASAFDCPVHDPRKQK